jgi:hypothetical protein
MSLRCRTGRPGTGCHRPRSGSGRSRGARMPLRTGWCRGDTYRSRLCTRRARDKPCRRRRSGSDRSSCSCIRRCTRSRPLGRRPRRGRSSIPAGRCRPCRIRRSSSNRWRESCRPRCRKPSLEGTRRRPPGIPSPLGRLCRIRRSLPRRNPCPRRLSRIWRAPHRTRPGSYSRYRPGRRGTGLRSHRSSLRLARCLRRQRRRR